MNKVILLGRLTRDPELRSTQSGVSLCSFSVAVDRRYKSASGERQTDFINCTAWRQTAEFIARYFNKGSSIALVGSIQTSSWEDNEGKKQFRTDVVIDEAYFTGSKGGDGGGSNQAERGSYQGGGAPAARPQTTPSYNDDFVPSPDDVILPFEM